MQIKSPERSQGLLYVGLKTARSLNVQRCKLNHKKTKNIFNNNPRKLYLYPKVIQQLQWLT